MSGYIYKYEVTFIYVTGPEPAISSWCGYRVFSRMRMLILRRLQVTQMSQTLSVCLLWRKNNFLTNLFEL